MSRLPQCFGCKKREFNGLTCEHYKEGIPREIVNDIFDCEHFEATERKDVDKSLPIAKGR